MKRRVLIGGIVLLAIAGYMFSRRGATEGTPADVTAVTRAATLQSFVTASGEIVATKFADIGSASMGRLVSLNVREGDRVSAGQLLARIDPVQASSSADAATAALRALESDAQAATTQIKASQAELAASEARAAEAERQVKRARELRQSGLIAQAEPETAAAQVRAAEAAIQRIQQSQTAAERRVGQARAEVARARDQLDKTDITAPINGVVTRLEVEEGEMVVIGVQNQPGTILMTISDLSSINAEVKVAEADVLRLALGNSATATLEALPGKKFAGQVVEIGASALPQVGT
jgi:HlyD family secretion protein